jgi:hypothetical protein
MARHPSRHAENDSADSVTELQSMPAAVVKDPTGTHTSDTTLDPNRKDEDSSGHVRGQIPPPVTAIDALERWNSPKKNRWRVLATFVSVLARPSSKLPSDFSNECQRSV